MNIEILNAQSVVVETIIVNGLEGVEAFIPEGRTWRIAEVQPPEAPGQRHITGLAFKNRMTATERKAIRAAAKVNQDIEDFMDLANSAMYIDLDRQDTRAGVLALEAATLIGVGRAAQILDAATQAHERYRA